MWPFTQWNPILLLYAQECFSPGEQQGTFTVLWLFLKCTSLRHCFPRFSYRNTFHTSCSNWTHTPSSWNWLWSLFSESQKILSQDRISITLIGRKHHNVQLLSHIRYRTTCSKGSVFTLFQPGTSLIWRQLNKRWNGHLGSRLRSRRNKFTDTVLSVIFNVSFDVSCGYSLGRSTDKLSFCWPELVTVTAHCHFWMPTSRTADRSSVRADIHPEPLFIVIR